MCRMKQFPIKVHEFCAKQLFKFVRFYYAAFVSIVLPALFYLAARLIVDFLNMAYVVFSAFLC